jgi:hypothetical protein
MSVGAMMLLMFTRVGQVDWSEDFPFKKESATDGRIKFDKAPSYGKKERGWLSKHDHGGSQLQPDGLG